ncbi:MAG: hypothetical protein GKS06_18825 [Acidobacteria bacterium]|nr:hypothetical protein [Acidobacteriota bacterium]
MSRIANRPLTKATDPHRVTDLIQLFLALLILLVPAFLYAAQRSDSLVANQTVGSLESELLALQQERELIELELQRLLEPRSLTERAQRVAGLQLPEDQVLVMAPAPNFDERVLLASEIVDGNR